MRRGWILCAAMLAAGAWFAPPAPGDSDGYGHQHLDTRCVVSETSWGRMVAAETSWMMWSDQESPDRYRWRARLIADSPGLNFHRLWSEVEADAANVSATGASSYYATVRTPFMSSNLDWDLEVKLTWDRENQRDGNQEYVLDFDEASCI